VSRVDDDFHPPERLRVGGALRRGLLSDAGKACEQENQRGDARTSRCAERPAAGVAA
jgi:hypothetical protein